MSEMVSLALLQSVIDSQKNLVTIFENNKLVVANRAFLKFFGATDVADFKQSFRSFTDCFVPHPSYFNRESLVEGEAWHESILRFEEQNRVVSMLTPAYEPHAFSVSVSEKVDNFRVVSFEDVTRTLIQRIMVENNATTDAKSGAYDKKYFMHIAKSYDDAALFNKKVIAICKITLDVESSDEAYFKEFVAKIKASIRNDDMLVRWNNESFLLVCLVESSIQIDSIVSKLKAVDASKMDIKALAQNKDENITALLKRVS